MKRSILVRGARQLLTLQGRPGPRRGEQMRQLSVIEDGSVLIVNGLIQRVGGTRQVENVAEARNAEEINASGHVVMPGFVDAHAHLIAPPARVVLSRTDSTDNPVATSTPSSTSAMNWVRNAAPSTLESNARRHLESALRHGTITLEAKIGYALNAPGELKSLRVLSSIGDSILSLVPTFFGAHALPPEFGTAEQFIGWLASDFIPKLREKRTVRYADALCDSGGFTQEQLRPYLAAAAQAGYPIKLQGDLTQRCGCADLAHEFSAVSASGLNHINESDIAMLAASSTIAMLLPARVKPGTEARFPPGRALLDAGAAVALATGFHPSAASTFNMQAVIALACAAMNFSVEEAISAATVNAAFAVGRGSLCGTLETGRQADLMILNASDYREIALHYGCNIVKVVIRRGEVAYREAPLTCARS